MTDATGKEIVVGQTYGYAMNSNGIIWSVVGKATKVTDKRVTLGEITERNGVYGEVTRSKDTDTKGNRLRSRSVYCALVFPVN
jgi:phosphoribosylformylglycinamidine (FGAM) synthase-like enzyme